MKTTMPFAVCIFLSFSVVKVRAELVDQIFQQKHPTREGLCFKSAELPTALKLLVSKLEGHRLVEPDFIRRYFMELSRPISDATQELDRQSTYFRRVQNMPNPRIFAGHEKLSQYSGASPNNLRLWSDDATRIFFESLFKSIALHSSSWNPTKLSRTDLFHAHLIHHRKKADIFLVFHAKEYPNDDLFEGEKKELLRYFGETLDPSILRSQPSPRFTRRNFVWSLRHNLVCGLDTTQPKFAALSERNSDPSTVDVLKFSDEDQAGEILNINYFPTEQAPSFLDVLRSIGMGL